MPSTQTARSVGVLGTGAYLPARFVPNDEVAPPAGVDDEWIVRKTGIRGRHWAEPDEATSDLALAAAEAALSRAGVDAGALSLIVVATSTPDSPQPPTATVLADRLGAPPTAAAFDLNAVCSGFVFATDLGWRVAAAAEDGHALVVGADIYSRITDPLDRRTAVLLGDGAGAVVLGPVGDGRGVLATRLLTFAEYRGLVEVPAGGSRMPASTATLAGRQHYFLMEGRSVVEFVRKHIPPAVNSFLSENRIAPERIRHLITHQANGKLIRTLAEDLGLPEARLHTTVERYGNTGAASVAVTLDDAARAGVLEPGDLVLLAAFGGGMSIGLALLRW
ncbi:3-oxoacyl-ACP synthase III family protein [Amycolatopsis sp. NPDC059021]|uniref:3-oxoacyl-ACP synthase III family protein n=1 Tax=Amycolatopsis sp. NPDC059021 TaxID=3346704 RepID=UPI00367015B3